MQFKKKVVYSALFSAAVLVASLILPITPCRIAPLAPPYSYKWTLCSLNPDVAESFSIKEFFGYTTSLKDSYFILIILAFFAAMIFFHFTTRRKKD